MKLNKLNTYLGSFFVLLIGVTLTVSTLHSHNHLEWHHPQNHIDTGTCLIIDSTQCPICGYLFKADVTRIDAVKVPAIKPERITEPSPTSVPKPELLFTKGRSPPALV